MTDDRPEEYDELVERVKKISNVGNAASVLQWDQEVMMPEGGTQARSQQLSALSSVRHDLLTKDEVGELLDSLRDSSLGDEERAVVREVRREYERADRVPNDLVERISRTTSEALPVWKEAKTEGDFSKFEPKLDTLVELRRDYAEHIDPDRSPYAVLFEEFEPYLGIDTAERILERLRDELVPMVEEIRRSDAEVGNRLPDRKYDEEAQKRLVREALDSLGYDWDRGRLDTAPHPFSTGT
ncbi:MAG: carboxypeptidase M32, partial [Halobacteria archaeon]|nr:carboxypeptidase M32 [Halobacteria archaeon]